MANKFLYNDKIDFVRVHLVGINRDKINLKSQELNMTIGDTLVTMAIQKIDELNEEKSSKFDIILKTLEGLSRDHADIIEKVSNILENK